MSNTSTLELKQAVFSSCQRFEDEFKTWLRSSRIYAPLEFEVHKEPYDRLKVRHPWNKCFDFRSQKLFPDVEQVSSFGGAIPKDWTGDQIIKVYPNAICYEEAFPDTMFMTGQVYEVFSLNGILRLLYERSMSTEIISMCYDTIDGLYAGGSQVPTRSNLKNPLRTYSRHKKSNLSTEKRRLLYDAKYQLTMEMKERLGNAVRRFMTTNRSIANAQVRLFGHPNPCPHTWNF